MPYISLQDQGFYDPGTVIQQAAARLLAQKQLAQEIAQRQAAFQIEQRQRTAQAAIDEANAGNIGKKIANDNLMSGAQLAALQQQMQQGASAFPLRLRLLGNEADTGAENLRQSQALFPINLRAAGAHASLAEADVAKRKVEDPLDIRQKTAEATIAEQNAIPTDEKATSDVDANGNITENIVKTKNGQPFGSASKIIRGNRPLGNTGGATKIQYITDPITGDPRGTLVTRVDPMGRIDQQVIPAAQLNPLGAPAAGTKGAAPAKPAPSAKPAASSNGSQPIVQTGSTLNAVKAQAAKTASPSAGQRKFKDLNVGEEFMQNGVRYRKTGDTSAEPVTATTTATASP